MKISDYSRSGLQGEDLEKFTKILANQIASAWNKLPANSPYRNDPDSFINDWLDTHDDFTYAVERDILNSHAKNAVKSVLGSILVGEAWEVAKGALSGV